VRSPEQLIELKDSVTAINEELAIPVDEQEICTNLKKGFTDILGIEIAEETMSRTEEALKNELINKYADSRWNNEGKKELFEIGDGT
jgi:lipoate-protein ligase A